MLKPLPSGGTKIPFFFDHTTSSPMAISPESGFFQPDDTPEKGCLAASARTEKVKILLPGIVRSTFRQRRNLLAFGEVILIEALDSNFHRTPFTRHRD